MLCLYNDKHIIHTFINFSFLSCNNECSNFIHKIVLKNCAPFLVQNCYIFWKISERLRFSFFKINCYMIYFLISQNLCFFSLVIGETWVTFLFFFKCYKYVFIYFFLFRNHFSVNNYQIAWFFANVQKN